MEEWRKKMEKKEAKTLRKEDRNQNRGTRAMAC